MHNELFSIGPVTIYGYGLMIALGMAVTITISALTAKKKGGTASHILDLAICALLSGFLGAKILACIVQWDEFVKAPLSFFGNSGLVIYGGIITASIGCFVFCKIAKLNFMQYFDILTPNVLIGHGIGRIGCFLAGCCYGIEYNGACHVVFENSKFAPNGVSLFPSQLVSSVFLIISGVILTIIVNKSHLKRGLPSALYIIIYSVGRFTIEFFRGDDRGFIGPLSTSQFIAILTLIVGIIWMILSLKNKFETKNKVVTVENAENNE